MTAIIAAALLKWGETPGHGITAPIVSALVSDRDGRHEIDRQTTAFVFCYAHTGRGSCPRHTVRLLGGPSWELAAIEEYV